MSDKSSETERTILLLLGIHVLSKLVDFANDLVPAMENAGAKLYDVVHNDADHVQDLPGKTLPRAAVLAIATLAGFPDPKIATAIALAESGGVTNAIARSSREVSIGLWQINTMVHPYSVEDMREPMKNAAAALKISKGGTDWRPWSAFTNGRYKHFQTGILA